MADDAKLVRMARRGPGRQHEMRVKSTVNSDMSGLFSPGGGSISIQVRMTGKFSQYADQAQKVARIFFN
jgi:hypothetical protein